MTDLLDALRWLAGLDPQNMTLMPNSTPAPAGAIPARSPYGNQRFGGNTYGGNQFGGNRFGASAGPGETGGTPDAERPSPYGLDFRGLMDELDEERRRKLERQAQAVTVNANPPGTSYYGSEGVPVPEADLPDYIGNQPGVAPSGSDADTRGREQFGLDPLPAPTPINRAPGDGVASVPQVAPAGFTPSAPPSAADAPTFAPRPSSGGSGYGDAISGLGALAQSLWRMGQPGLRDHGGDLDPITNLPTQLQQRRLNEQHIQGNDIALAQQQAVMQHMQSPEFAAQFKQMPAALQGLIGAAAKAGDYRTIAGVLAQQARFSQPVNVGNGWVLDRSTGIAHNPTTGQSAMLGANGNMTPISAPGAQTAAPTQQGGNSPAPAWAKDLPEGVDVNKLAGLSDDIRNRAIRVINGLDPMPSSARNNPINAAVSSAVAAAAPGFDPARAKGAADMIKNVSSGKIADELTNFATVHAHAGELADAAKAMKNGDIVAANRILNNLGYQSGSSARVVFDNIQNAYTHELQGVLAKGHITDAEMKQSNAGISSDMSPRQIADAMAAGQKLMRDKIEQRYATAFTAAGKRIDPYFERFGLSGGPQARRQEQPQQSGGASKKDRPPLSSFER